MLDFSTKPVMTAAEVFALRVP